MQVILAAHNMWVLANTGTTPWCGGPASQENILLDAVLTDRTTPHFAFVLW